MPFWPPKWSPGGAQIAVLRPLGAVQDGLGIVLVRSFFRLVVRDRFFGRLGLLLGSFLGAPWVVLVLFRHFNSSIQPINSSIRRFNPSTHQPTDSTHQAIISSIQPINPSIQFINSSTHGPSALSYPARRTARCAIISAARNGVEGIAACQTPQCQGPNHNCRSLICLTYGQFLWSWSQLVFRSLS